MSFRYVDGKFFPDESSFMMNPEELEAANERMPILPEGMNRVWKHNGRYFMSDGWNQRACPPDIELLFNRLRNKKQILKGLTMQRRQQQEDLKFQAKLAEAEAERVERRQILENDLSRIEEDIFISGNGEGK